MANPTDRRWLAVGQALLHENYTVDQVHELTKIDRWFLHKLMNIVNMYRELETNGHLSIINHDLMSRAKKLGFSDKQIGLCVGADELEVRRVRKIGNYSICEKIDTLAAEFPANTNYIHHL